MVYPKDIGAIIILADVFPGARVVEAGFGSGALTLALLRAVGERGSVTSYELREGQAKKALKNIGPLLPQNHRLTIKEGDIYQDIQEREVDRLSRCTSVEHLPVRPPRLCTRRERRSKRRRSPQYREGRGWGVPNRK